MARILGNPFGELRGKLGGTVFSKNKSGQIARVLAKPTNPMTLKQIKNRISLGSITQMWANLTKFQKNQWNDFALNDFSPFQGTNSGQFTGFNAFVALNKALRGQKTAPLVESIGVSGADEFEVEIGEIKLNAPLSGPSNSLVNVAEEIINATLSTCTLYTNGVAEVKIDLEINGNPPQFNGDVKLANGENAGFAIFRSNTNSTEGDTYNEPFRNLIGIVPNIKTSAGLASTEYWDFSFPETQQEDYKYAPREGQYALLSVWIFSGNGQYSILGAKEVQIEE